MAEEKTKQMQTNAFNKSRSGPWLMLTLLPDIKLRLPGFSAASKRKWIMRINITTFILMIALMQVTAKGFSQKVTLDKKNVPLKTILKSIELQTGFLFLTKDYNINQPKVTVSLKNASIDEAMNECLKDLPLSYIIIDNSIILSKKEVSIYDRITNYFKAIEVLGQVFDETGKTLPGATVKIKGTERTAVTNALGMFTFKGVDENAVLVVSFLGYKTKEVRLSNSTEPLIIKLEINSAELDAVNVVSTGYQKLPKERLTGSFALVEQADLNKQIAVSDITEKFKTLLPGVLMVGNSAIIRGKSTMNANQSPIIVIDGFPTDLSLSTVNPNDVETITVLRDAAAASIWGVRASNGVIVITTKQGRRTADGKPAISFSSTFKIQEVPDIADLKLANSNQIIDVEIEALTKGWYNLDNPSGNGGYTPVYDVFRKKAKGLITEDEANLQYNILRNNDSRSQQDLFFKNGLLQQYNLSASGATERNRYYVSLNYQKNQSYAIGNNDKRLTLFVKNSFQLFPKLSLDVDVNLSYIKGASNGISVGDFARQRPYELFLDAQGNYVPVYESIRSLEKNKELQDKGYYDWNNNLKREKDNYDKPYNSFSPRVNLGVSYKVLEGVVFDSKFQHERMAFNSSNFMNEESFTTRNQINNLTTIGAGNVLNFQIPRGPIYDTSVQNTQSTSWRNQFRFDKELAGGKHRINAVVGTEINRVLNSTTNNRYHNYNKERLTSSPINEKLLAAGVPGWNGSLYNYVPIYNPFYEGQNRYFSMYFNGSYTYLNKYTLSASARKDKSNQLGANINDKLTPLYSLGAAWNVSKEDFFKVDFIDDLRFRLTTGINGNVDKSTSKVLIAIPQKNNSSTNEDFLKMQFPENKDLRWESTRVNNIGMDLTLLNSRINVNLDVYTKKSYDLLGYVNADPSVGFQRVYKNTSTMLNRGFDLRLSADIFRGDFRWNALLNLSYNKNKVTKVYNPNPTLSGYLTGGRGNEIVDMPIDYFYNLRWAGLNDKGEPQVYNDKGVAVSWQNNAQPNIDWLDYAGTTLPKYYGSFINTFSYKGFSLTPIFTYRLGHTMRLPTTYLTPASSSLNNIDNRWQRAGDESNTYLPKLYSSQYEPLMRFQFYTLNNLRQASASYVRLSNVSLTYDLPKNIAGKVFKNIQLQTQVTDLWLWVKNKEQVDPEVANLREGRLNLSPPITYSFGVKVDF